MLRLAAEDDFNNDIVRGLIRRKPDVDIVCIQGAGLSGAGDPAVLKWAAEQRRLLVSHDVSTLSKHAYERVAAGLRMPGAFDVPNTLGVGRAIEDLLLIVDMQPRLRMGGVRYLPL